jgi:hypothetical protein
MIYLSTNILLHKYSVIYLDKFFFNFSKTACYFDHLEQIPYNCNTVGLVFYSFDQEHIINTINQIKPRTQQLLIVLSEPVGDIINILTKFQHDPSIVFFGDAVLNQPLPNFYPVISWFLSPNNLYANEVWAQNLLKLLDHSDSKAFKFDCLLGNQKHHRDIVESLYQQSSFREHFLFSYFKNKVDYGIWNQDCTKYTLTTEPILVSTIQDSRYYAPLSAIIPDYIYNQSSHSIVCETTSFNSFSQFTEKVAKPILAQRIFVAFCGQWYLRNLRSLGFQTFDSIINESYDAESDIINRYQKAWAQVEYLCQQDSSKIRSQVRDILIYNQQHFLNTDWHQNTRRFIN